MVVRQSKRSPKFHFSRKNDCSSVKTFAKISFFSKRRLFVNQNVRQHFVILEKTVVRQSKRSPKFHFSRKNGCSSTKTFAKISQFFQKRLFVNQNVRQNLAGYERVFKDLRNERVFKDLRNARIWYFS